MISTSGSSRVSRSTALLIGGADLARGYLNDPELTALRFVATPFGRAYQSGDLGRYHSDGTIEFLGRLDEQVKLRGVRIEPGEVERALSEHALVKEAAVVAAENIRGEPQLMAHVTGRPAGCPSSDDLRRFLRQRLAAVQVLATFVMCERPPRLPNGKVDRQALAARPLANVAGGRPVLAPRDELEDRLAHIWQELLEVWPIGVTDNFFELGGHSLLVARLVARVERAVGRPVPLSGFVEAPTIEDLARALCS